MDIIMFDYGSGYLPIRLDNYDYLTSIGLFRTFLSNENHPRKLQSKITINALSEIIVPTKEPGLKRITAISDSFGI